MGEAEGWKTFYARQLSTEQSADTTRLFGRILMGFGGVGVVTSVIGVSAVIGRDSINKAALLWSGLMGLFLATLAIAGGSALVMASNYVSLRSSELERLRIVASDRLDVEDE
jgi:hypothetical protein